MSCCPDRVGMKKNNEWSYYKTVKNIRVNAGYVSHCLTQDPDVLKITSDVTARTGKSAWAECANVRHINAQVVECDLKVYVKVLAKPANAITVKVTKKKRSCPRTTSRLNNYVVVFEDEDGDTSEETFNQLDKDQLLKKLDENWQRFGLWAISVNGKQVKAVVLTDEEARQYKEYVGDL